MKDDLSIIDTGEILPKDELEAVEVEAVIEAKAEDDKPVETNEEIATVEVADEVEAVTPEQFVPKYEAQSTDDLSAKYEELNTAYATLSEKIAAQHESGEISFKDYTKQQNELNIRYYNERSSLDAAKFEASVFEKQNSQAAEQAWKHEQEVFLSTNPSFKDEIVYDALSGTLTRLYSDPAYADKTQSELLHIAADKVGAKFNIDMQSKRPPALKAVPARQAVELPTTLANVPPAASNVEVGEFDNIDKLKGEAYEKALSKLSQEQRARYMAA
jgi:hypothetical protein